MKLLMFLFLILPQIASAKTIRIAIVDSGIYIKSNTLKLCPGLSRDFTYDLSLQDKLGHGQNIAHIISDRIQNVDHCFVIIKVFSNASNGKAMNSSNEGLEYALKLKVDIVNYSAGGEEPNETEERIITNMLENKMKVIVAAGNEGNDLDDNCNYYPACYRLQNLMVVGNLNKNGTTHNKSNRGVYLTAWRIGEDVIAGGLMLTGTSQATAVYTSDIVKELANE